MGLPVYEKLAKRTKITLNCIVKENPIKGQFRIKIDENDFICDLREAIRENQRSTFEYSSLGINPRWVFHNSQYDVCDKGFALKKTLNKHKESNTHDKMLGRERKAKNLPSDPDSDEGNEDNSISLTSNDITAFNKEIENLGPGDEDSDMGYDTP
ncbi:12991_t:CDS:2 [Funneliformis caledonium]|uniref:12991_t:CDS:1 n=1 Tax=Funneliformis caledonium TaxID=1117310 RepID=A0A9N9BD36_9GLOM|nr:12991_t:CDS:2 [Funneliformis caledonium]